MRKVTVKIGLKQEDDKKEIIVDVLLDSGVMILVMSLEFVRNNKFRKKKLERLIYIRNVDNIFNHEEPIEHTVEIELFYKEHKKITVIDVIEGQKWSVILGMPCLAYHNSEINWKTEEVKMTRYPNEYEK